MKSAAEIMSELGFNKDAKNETKEAFIKHLIKASVGVDVATPTEKREVDKAKNVSSLGEANKATQLCFNLDECG